MIFHWGKFSGFQGIGMRTFYERGTVMRKVNLALPGPVGFRPMMKPFPQIGGNVHPHPAMPSQPMPIARANVPALADHPGRQTGPTRGEYYYPHPTKTEPPVKGEPDPGTDPEDPHPPRPREKERKIRVPAVLRRVLSAAYALTETKDAIEAIWEALPKELQESTRKSGKTRKGAIIGEGRAYSTVNDKARQLYDHWDEVDLEQAMINLAVNHVTDEMLGRLFGNSDRWHQQNTHGNRLLNIS